MYTCNATITNFHLDSGGPCAVVLGTSQHRGVHKHEEIKNTGT